MRTPGLSGQERIILFLGVLFTATLLLILGHVDQHIFRDLILGSLAPTLMTSAHARHIDRKYQFKASPDER